MAMSSTLKGALIGAAATIIAATIPAWFGGKAQGFNQGKAQGVNEGKTEGIQEGINEGKKGKKPAFDKIPTQVSLNQTEWEVVYEDVGPQKTSEERKARVTFEQVGSRIVGDGEDTSGRKWILEGATAERRVCYIYYEPGGPALSFGTVFLEMSNNGNEMSGQWAGWAPEGGKVQPRKVRLRRILR